MFNLFFEFKIYRLKVYQQQQNDLFLFRFITLIYLYTLAKLKYAFAWYGLIINACWKCCSARSGDDIFQYNAPRLLCALAWSGHNLLKWKKGMDVWKMEMKIKRHLKNWNNYHFYQRSRIGSHDWCGLGETKTKTNCHYYYLNNCITW